MGRPVGRKKPLNASRLSIGYTETRRPDDNKGAFVCHSKILTRGEATSIRATYISAMYPALQNLPLYHSAAMSCILKRVQPQLKIAESKDHQHPFKGCCSSPNAQTPSSCRNRFAGQTFPAAVQAGGIDIGEGGRLCSARSILVFSVFSSLSCHLLAVILNKPEEN